VSRSLPLVVVIPGIGGSTLADDDGRMVYHMDTSSMVARIRDPQVLEIGNSLRPTGLIGAYSVVFKQLVTGYENLMTALTQKLGLSQAQVATAGPELVAPDASLLAFPYDFRQPVQETAVVLDRELRRRAQGRPVVLVAHSMGGLVAAWWWAFLGEGINVAEIITLGTPYRGAAKALEVLVNGIRFGGVEQSKITAVLRDWGSVFDLLPHYQAIEGNPDGPYPYQLPPSMTMAMPDFSTRAQKAYDANKELHRTLEEKTRERKNPFTTYYSQGHATPGRAVVEADRLITLKENPPQLTDHWNSGDGTVPVFSTIPPFLEDEIKGRRRLSKKHQDLVEEERFLEHMSEYVRDRLPTEARGDEGEGPLAYLQVDLNDVVPAREFQTVRVSVVNVRGEELAAGGVDGSVAGQKFQAERDGGSWIAQLPPLDEGVYRLRISAVGVPKADQVIFSARVGAVSCASE
jgi:hypothetical protein